jgi:photosystem II stability/assembly factor-like uncharacterized protein
MQARLSSRVAVTAIGIALALVVLHPVTFGQSPSVWVRTGGPSGGIGYDIRARSDNPNVMFVTDAMAGVHRSVDAGFTWHSVNQGIDARSGPASDQIPAFSVTIDPNNPHVIWAGMAQVNGIYRSVDSGTTWEKRTNGIVEQSGFTVRGITVEPGNSNVVYVAGEIDSFTWAGTQLWGKQFDRVRGVVYKSIDAGQNWHAIWRGDNLARYVVVDPRNPATVYISTGIFDREAANSQPEFNAPGGVGILKSVDSGASWTAINDGLRNLYVGSLFAHPLDSRTLLAGTGNESYRAGGGIYLTTDAGVSWHYVGGQYITAVEFSTFNPSIAYAAGANEFYRSSDGGRSWRAYLNRAGRLWGPPGVVVGFPIDMQVDPRDPFRVFINNYGGGNFLTLDGGTSWSVASDGYTGATITDVAVSRQNPAVVYANTLSGPFKSIDGGQSWIGINPEQLRPLIAGARVTVDPEDGNHVLLSSAHQGSTYESLDGGRTFRLTTDYDVELRRRPDGFDQGMQAMAFAPSWRLKVYGGFGVQSCVSFQRDCARSTIVSLLTSEDGGRTWTRRTGTGFDGLSVPAITVHPHNRDVAWAATLGRGVFKTTDGGSRWSPLSIGLEDSFVHSIAVDPMRPDILYAGTGARGIFKSRNGGATWTSSSVGMPSSEQIRTIVVHPSQSDVIYAGSLTSGVYASRDGGTSWTSINSGLRNRTIHALSISSVANVLYAGTHGEGVFRLIDSGPPCGAPGSPSPLTFSQSGAAVTVHWSAAAGAADYVIEVGSAPGLANLLVLPLGATTSISTLAPQGRYYARIRARNACGLGPASNEILVIV